MRPHPVQTSVSPLRDQLEQWTKIAVAVVAIVYVVGFVVHTLYLGAYGVVAVNLLRAQYILAGFWLLSPFALIGGWLAWVSFVREQDAQTGTRPTASYLTGTAVYTIGVIAATAPFLHYFSLPVAVKNNDVGWLIGIVLALVLSLVMAVYANHFDERATLPKRVGTLVLVAVLFIAYASRFAIVIYPGISSVIGGGAPVIVRLVLEPGPPVLPVDANGLTPASYPLLVATDHSIVVLDRGRATEVMRDKIKAVLYEPPRR